MVLALLHIPIDSLRSHLESTKFLNQAIVGQCTAKIEIYNRRVDPLSLYDPLAVQSTNQLRNYTVN